MMRAFREAIGDRKGAAAIEFALIFPMIFLLNIAAAETLQVYQAQRAVAHIAATMADIVAQNRSVSDAELTDILSASTVMIYPFDNTSLQQRVSSLVANGSGTVSVEWTAHRNYSGTDTPSAPSGYLAANESTVVADVVYDYKPSFGFFLPDTIRFKRQAFARPRLTTKVEKLTN